ncbi:succinylglutamate desuccinylase/aspartoacylase family protein [Paenibacillus sp. IB182496]|uniref:Succinylglutamate desuccinylase/aspartoacylase family protein n=1 Tax=Paenibacillus sabuli TaxID=2772509 RepID=A0A927GVE2_9BACL|nr:succinylglutamate desuccinylase/aspartoacylase family protein [Paenibacillus sabuli]MBD2848657.1 succinylglutamate desuccinylase/aspartoacylase family protein [Paenibacillus sabuli]
MVTSTTLAEFAPETLAPGKYAYRLLLTGGGAGSRSAEIGGDDDDTVRGRAGGDAVSDDPSDNAGRGEQTGQAGHAGSASGERGEGNGYVPVHVVRGVQDGPCLLVLAAVHGDEYEGVQTVIELSAAVQPKELCGTLLLVPVANVDAYRSGTRCSAADGGNLARAFPGSPDGSYTERLAWHLQQALIRRCDFLLDLHSAGTHYAMPLMTGFDAREGADSAVRSRDAALCFGVPVAWAHDTVSPGRTVSMASELGIPWIYVEGFGGRRIRKDEQRLYTEGAWRLMAHLGMLAAPELRLAGEPQPVELILTGDGNLDGADLAACDGFFVPAADLLDELREGDLVGTIVDWRGAVLQTVRADGSGVVMLLRQTPVVSRGDALYTLARKEGTDDVD